MMGGPKNGFAVATDMPYLEPMRLGSTIGGGSDTLGYADGDGGGLSGRYVDRRPYRSNYQLLDGS
jgi:hypothetical protein